MAISVKNIAQLYLVLRNMVLLFVRVQPLHKHIHVRMVLTVRVFETCM